MTFKEFKARYSFDPNRNDVLGSGGQGKVYKAYDTLSNEAVAIKYMPPGTGGDGKYSLVRENELAQKIPKHPNLVTYREAFRFETEAGPVECAVLSYYPLGSLASIIKANPRGMPPNSALPIVQGILRGIAHVHQQNIVHRDLKPANILMAYREDVQQYVPLIADLGISKQATDNANSMISNSGIGTLPYRSPEQYANRNIGRQSDLWTLGAIVYEILKGRRMFGPEANSSDTEIIYAINNATLPADIASLPEPYLSLVMKCMVTDVKYRLLNAEAGLAIVDSEEPVTIIIDPVPAPVPSPSPVPAAKPISFWNKWTIGSAIALAVAFVSYLVFSLPYPPAPVPEPILKPEPINISSRDTTSTPTVVSITQEVPPTIPTKITVESHTRSFASYTESGISPAMRMIAIPGGSFDMGCTSEQQDCFDNEKPAHRVTVSGFYMCETEVTQAQWRTVMRSNPSYFIGCDNCPVEQVSWDDVQTYIGRLNAQCGRTYRLPTEAEWEYAARGGDRQVMFGNGRNILDPSEANFNASANYAESYSRTGQFREETIPVKSFVANAFGLYDMTGNVWEWCSDWNSDDYYANSPSNNPKGPRRGKFRTFRGGSWNFLPMLCRVAYRSRAAPGYRVSNLGFRLVSSQ